MSIQETRKAVEHYMNALTMHGAFGDSFSDSIVVTFEGTDQRAEGREAAWQLITAAHELGDIRIRDLVVGEGRAAVEADFIRRDGETVPYAVMYDLDAGKITGLRIYMTGPVQ